MKILVTGVAGMLGHKMFQVLRRNVPGTLGTAIEDVRKPPFDRLDFLQGPEVMSGVDVTDFAALEGLLNDVRPDFVVNCVGIIKQRDEAARAIPSITVNALLPHKLAAFAGRWGGRVIHPSTDCVFNGKKGEYSEDDPSDAEDLYGRTKYLGELSCSNGLTLRTSIIGRELVEHKSLLDWLLSQERKTIQGFRRVIYSGVTTQELADLVARIILGFPELNGLYQVASEPISKYDLLGLLKDAYKVAVEIVPEDVTVSDRSLKGDKLRQAIGYRCPSWPELIRTLAEDPTPYDRLDVRSGPGPSR